MHELVARNGTVVDGTGSDRRPTDIAIAIEGDTIVAVEPPGEVIAEHGELTAPRPGRLQRHRVAG